MTRVVDSREELVPLGGYIGRGYAGQVPSAVGEYGWLGNPFRMGAGVSRSHSIRLFMHYFYARLDMDVLFRWEVGKLHGKTLGCFCKPKACHGDVIVAYLDNQGLFS